MKKISKDSINLEKLGTFAKSIHRKDYILLITNDVKNVIIVDNKNKIFGEDYFKLSTTKKGKSFNYCYLNENDLVIFLYRQRKLMNTKTYRAKKGKLELIK